MRDGTPEMLTRAGALAGAGIGIADVALRRPGLDDVFLALTGHPTGPAPDPDGDPARSAAPKEAA